MDFLLDWNNFFITPINLLYATNRSAPTPDYGHHSKATELRRVPSERFSALQIERPSLAPAPGDYASLVGCAALT